MTAYDEHRLAELIKSLPPAPEAWVEAAQELAFARGRLDDIVARAEADLAFRDALVANLEEALRLEGYEPETLPLDELRRRLDA
jgi:predicted ArsR family transcriptional regulator